MNKNWKWYIDNDDLFGCYERFEQARTQWKNHWWNTIEKIYKNSSYWAKYYILDNVKRVIKKIIQIIPKEEKIGLCYWIRLIGESGVVIYNKIGTTTRELSIRMNEILKNQYKDDFENIVKYEILGTWEVLESQMIGLESFFRSMLIKKYNGKNFIQNDRFFIGNQFQEPTLEEMQKYVNLYFN